MDFDDDFAGTRTRFRLVLQFQNFGPAGTRDHYRFHVQDCISHWAAARLNSPP
jgi:hypothetical protein